MLPLFGEANSNEIVLEGENQVKLKYLTAAMTILRSSGKSTSITWLRFFIDGDGSLSKFIVKAFLAYWYCHGICCQMVLKMD